MDKWEKLKEWLKLETGNKQYEHTTQSIVEKMEELENPKILVDKYFLESIEIIIGDKCNCLMYTKPDLCHRCDARELLKRYLK